MKNFVLLFSFLISFSFSNSSFARSIEFSEEDPVTEESFNKTINRLKEIYPDVPFAVDWSNDNLQAHVSRGVIFLSGGFARKKGISLGGFLTVACHEVGHARLNLSEGEADYFATSSCMKRFFKGLHNESAIEKIIDLPESLTELCFKNSATKEEKNICIRTLISSINAANLGRARCQKRMNDLEEKIITNTGEDFKVSNHYFRCLRTITSIKDTVFNRLKLLETTQQLQVTFTQELDHLNLDSRIVSETYHMHNSPRCRMETLTNGAINLHKPRCWFKN